MAHSASASRTWSFYAGDWHEGNVPIWGPRTHAIWLGSSVFDGARAFDGVTPDIDRHCRRVNDSAVKLGLKALVPLDTWLGLVRDGVKRFGPKPELYIRPMYWGESGSRAVGARGPRIDALVPDDVRHADAGTWDQAAITLSPYRKPTLDTMPVDAKAGCLYPNNARAMIEAAARGFDNCLMRDQLGNIAELGTANIFLARKMAWCIRRSGTARS